MYSDFKSYGWNVSKNCHRLYSGYSNQTDKKVLISTWQSLYKLPKKYFEQFEKPIFPLKAQDLLEKYKLKEGKEFGQKIRLLEEMWLNNSFKISNKEIDKVFGN